MSATIHPLLPEPATPTAAPTRKPYSFDICQTDVAGMVLIDACVPYPLALAFLQMLTACQDKV